MQLSNVLEYFKDEKSIGPLTTPGQLYLPDVVQAARDSARGLEMWAGVVNRDGTQFSRLSIPDREREFSDPRVWAACIVPECNDLSVVAHEAVRHAVEFAMFSNQDIAPAFKRGQDDARGEALALPLPNAKKYGVIAILELLLRIRIDGKPAPSADLRHSFRIVRTALCGAFGVRPDQSISHFAFRYSSTS